MQGNQQTAQPLIQQDLLQQAQQLQQQLQQAQQLQQLAQQQQKLTHQQTAVNQTQPKKAKKKTGTNQQQQVCISYNIKFHYWTVVKKKDHGDKKPKL